MIDQIAYYNLDFQNNESLLNKIPTMSPYKNDGKEFIYAAENFAEELPCELRQHIRNFSRYSNKNGCFLVKTSGLNLTPRDTPHSMLDAWEKDSFHSEHFIAALGSLLGDVFTYKQMHKGVLVHNLFPIQSESNDLSSLSSNKFLDLHTEDSFHPINPDYLIIGCLRTDRDKKAISILSSINHVIRDLSDEIISLLKQELYQTGIQHNAEVEGPGPVIAILSGDDNNLFLNFDPDLMRPKTREAAIAMQQLKKALYNNRFEYFLEPGDFLILDNRKVMHGRYPFQAYFDKKDRWLQRVYVTKQWATAKVMYRNGSRAIYHEFEKTQEFPKIELPELTTN